jgi:UTP:GlnB (protein PII) uridylyltransferase
MKIWKFSNHKKSKSYIRRSEIMLENNPKKQAVILGALLHDVGKRFF